MLASYPPSNTTVWPALTTGAVLTVGLVALGMRSGGITLGRTVETRTIRPELLLAGPLMLFGFYGGVGFTRAGSVSFEDENAVLRSFAIGAALGVIALFALGSHLAARLAKMRALE